MHDLAPDTPVDKRGWRARIKARRRSVTVHQRAAEAVKLSERIIGWAARIDPVTICAYVPVGSEPGTAQFLDELSELGHRVLLPIVAGSAPLDWAFHLGADALRRGPYGLLEPAGQPIGAGAITIASFVFVPALAVDRDGNRLGRGAGHYDRTLSRADPDTKFIAVVRDEEVVGELPSEPHDIRMHAVVTPGHGPLLLPL